MKNFEYRVAQTAMDTAVVDGTHAMMIAGGTELLNWLRLGIAAPGQLVDIGRLEGLDRIRFDDNTLSIGALASLNEVGEHPLIRKYAAALGQACLAAASAQVRNRATIGGNILQKTRCAYFRAELPLPWGCNKREPGSGCAALNGVNELHALFGWTSDCVATYPADPPVAAVCLGAELEIKGSSGSRRVSVENFLLTQEEAQLEGLDAARKENRLGAGELITALRIPVGAGLSSVYLKVRERASYEYAIVSAAAAVRLEGRRIAAANLVVGSVAQRPWRLNGLKQTLVGATLDAAALRPIIDAATRDARPLSQGHAKLALARNAAVRAILMAGGAA